MKELGVGILGFGTVGAGVAEGLLENGELIAKRLGTRLVLRRIADLDLKSDRGVKVDPSVLTTDAVSVIDDPHVHIIVELIGGATVARDLILRALAAGKPVVTANKALLAEHGEDIYAAAEANKVDLYYEASVAGGIPIIRAFREGLIGNHIESIHGILNGTCNYILTRMEEEGLPFEQVLQEAQDAGFAEAEPSLDIDGLDTAHKAVILASLVYGLPVTMSDVDVAGIRGIDPDDIQYAAERGYRIKLLAIIKHVAGEIEIRVQPTLLPASHMLAGVSGVFNAVLVKGDVVGETMYYGKGAGRAPTASAVISDVAEVARNLVAGAESRVPAFVEHGHYGRVRPSDEIEVRYYLRLALKDEPAVLGQVAQVLGEHGISIASVVQKEARGVEHIPVIILTYMATEKAFRAALKAIDGLDIVGDKTVRYRIEDF